jgi:hypothetical protein
MLFVPSTTRIAHANIPIGVPVAIIIAPRIDAIPDVKILTDEII